MKKLLWLVDGLVLTLLLFRVTSSPVLAVERGFSRTAYNPHENIFLLVWQEGVDIDCYEHMGVQPCNNDIYAAFLDSNLDQIGGNFPIASSTNDEKLPEVVYNSQNNQYLVVYQRQDGYEIIGGQERAAWNIYAVRLDENGQVLETITVCDERGKQWEPVVAYNSIDNQYLIAFMGYFLDGGPGELGKDVKIQRLSADGQKIGLPAFVSVDEDSSYSRARDWQERPVVVFVPESQKYVIVWEDGRQQSVGGTVLNASGEIIISPQNFFLGEGTGNKRYPQIAYNQFNQELMTVWQNDKSAVRAVEAQRIDFLGNKKGDLIVIDENVGPSGRFDNPRPGLDCDPLNGSCLTTWGAFGGINYGLTGQFVDRSGQKTGEAFYISHQGSRSTAVLNEQERYFLVIESRERVGVSKFNPQKIDALPSIPVTPTPTVQPQVCPDDELGNLNCDPEGLINEADLELLLEDWSPQGPIPTPPSGQASADLNGDGGVDELDLSMLLSNWRAE